METCIIPKHCCPDFVYPWGGPYVPVAKCMNIDQLLNDDRLKNNVQLPNYPLSHTFLIIGNCSGPGIVNDSDDISSGCSNPTTLEDYVPVSSKDRHMVFRNKHCAYCYGYINDVVPWDLQLLGHCTHVPAMLFSNSTERNTYIYENCFLGALPPTDVSVQKLHVYRRIK